MSCNERGERKRGRDLFGAGFEFFYAGEEFFGRLAVIVEDAEVAVPSDRGQPKQEADDPAGESKGQFILGNEGGSGERGLGTDPPRKAPTGLRLRATGASWTGVSGSKPSSGS